MRGLASWTLIAGFALLAAPAVCAAEEATASISKFTVTPVPVPRLGGGKWPQTGNIAGAGAALELEYEFQGRGYGGTPQSPTGGLPPVSQINLYLPEGVRRKWTGFGSCTETTLRNVGLVGCPGSARLSSPGMALGEVTFGAARVPEASEWSTFAAPAGGLLFYELGHSPVSLEVVSPGQFKPAASPYGEALETLLAPVATVPGAPLASINTLKFTVGAATKSHGEVQSYFTLPATCSSGGLAFKTEVTFGGEFGGAREFGIPAKTLLATYRAAQPASCGGKPPETALPGTGGVITAPSNKQCVSRRHFILHVRHHPPLVYRSVIVELNGRRLDVIRERRISAAIDLRGLPKGLYAVRISVVTTTGKRISGTRSYHTCAPKPIKPKGKSPL